jgi:uncharacterized protein (DUF4415 family)
MKLDKKIVTGMSEALENKDENKTRISLRLDNEIIEFFKANSPQYQTAINRVLKAFVDEVKK